MKPMMRAWFHGTRKTMVFVEAPFPAVGEQIKMPDGTILIVKRIRAEEGFTVSFPKREANV